MSKAPITINELFGEEEPRQGLFGEYEPPKRVSLVINDSIRQAIREEVAAVVKQEMAANVKPERVVETKIIEKAGAKTETIVIREVDQKALEKTLSERLATYSKQTEERWKNIAPIVVPNGVPNQEGHNGHVLSTDGRQAKWIASTSGGSSSDAYTPTNVTTTRSFDATLTSLDEIASVLGSLIASLQGAGIIK